MQLMKHMNHNGKCFNYIAQAPQLSLDDPDIKTFQNNYGTHLDCQLHKELCQTQKYNASS